MGSIDTDLDRETAQSQHLKMSKRQCVRNSQNKVGYDRITISRLKAEQMCQQKLKQVKKVKSKLCQIVLVRNTLKYVQNSDNNIFSQSLKRLEPDEYEPFSKKSCLDISSDDIDNILCEIYFPSQQQSTRFEWQDSTMKKNTEDASVFGNDDSVVPGDEVLKYPSDEEYLDELLRNRTNCSVTKVIVDNQNMELDIFWHPSMF